MLSPRIVNLDTPKRDISDSASKSSASDVGARTPLQRDGLLKSPDIATKLKKQSDFFTDSTPSRTENSIHYYDKKLNHSKHRHSLPFTTEKTHSIRVLSNPSTPKRFNPISPMRSPSKSANNTTNDVPPIITASDVDKKRLVNQFFDNVANDSRTGSKSSSSYELSKLLQSPILTATPSELINFTEDKSDNIPDKITDEDFERILTNGGFEFHASSNRLADDEDLTSYILNIDRTFEEWSKKEHHLQLMHESFDGTSLKPLRELLESFTLILTINARTLLLQDDDHQVESLKQLFKLKEYLSGLSKITNDILDSFVNQKDEIKVKFRQEINENINRLNDLLFELNKLETQLNTLKSSINENKVIISKELPEKLKTLEYIDERFQKHSSAVNSKRFMNFNIMLGVIILAFSVYYGYKT